MTPAESHRSELIERGEAHGRDRHQRGEHDDVLPEFTRERRRLGQINVVTRDQNTG